MAVNYPTSLDNSTTLTQPQGTALLTSPDHALDHTNLSLSSIALQTKLGINSSTPNTNQILVSPASGQSTWGSVITSGSLVSPNINGGTISNGTINNPVIGTMSATGGTYTSALLATPTINNSTLGTFTAKGMYNCGTVAGLGTVNWANGDRQVYTISANGTVAFTNAGTGQILTLEILQNATGGYSLVFPTMKWPYGAAGTVGTAASAINTLTVLNDFNGNYCAQLSPSYA
jgi:hypothetical protein